jgi:hypothetical protein
MTATKKVVAKKAPVKKKPVAPIKQTFAMPTEVKNWIDRAQSIMNHQKGQIDLLKKENAELKSWRRWAENRILRSDHET